MRLIVLLLFLMPVMARAQAPPPGAHVTGHVVFEDSSTRYSQVKIYNKRTNTFVVPKINGFFELYGYKQDVFVFTCLGYEQVNLCYKDSPQLMTYEISITLHQLEMNLAPITIIADKTFDQIQQEIDNLGVINTDTYKDVSPQNAISFLYEMFSKTEKGKREVARLENDDMRRKALLELLKICIKSDLIDLSFSDCNEFIDYCHFSDEYLQHVNLYDLLSNIKFRYKYFKAIKP